MTFTVTYRETTGAKAEVEIEASSRAECVAAGKRRGIAPVGIREGRASSRPRAAETAAPHAGGTKGSGGTLWRAAILAATCLAAGIGAWWWLGREDAPPAQPPAAKPKAAKPQPKPRPATRPQTSPVAAESAAETKHVQTPDSARPPRMHLGLRVISSESTTNGGVVVERLRTEDGKVHSIVFDVAPPAFEHPTDEILAALPPADGTSSSPPPPAVRDLDRRFAESLKTEIKILDTDTDDIREMKQKVIELRAEVKKLLDQGLTMDEVLREHRRLAEENESMRRNVLVELKKMIASGDESMALEYRKRANAALEQMGIAPVAMAVTADEKATRAEERRERAHERRKARESD